MPITNTDFIVKQHMTYGTPCLAVWWFRKDAAHQAGDASRLATAFDTTINEAVAGIVNTSVTFDRIEVLNLVDVFDYWSITPTDTAGDVVSTSPGPRFLAYKFRMLRTRLDGRNGYKRFPGVAEELVAGESSNVTGALSTAIPLLVAQMDGSITSGGSVFNPMIPHRELVTLPNNEEQYILTDLFGMGAVSFMGLTTQNTRKA